MIKIFFDRLNIEKINYAVMRNYECLPEIWGNDIDILLNAKELDLFNKVIEDVFDKSSIIEIRESLSYRGYYIMLDNSHILLIDVFTDLRNRAFSYGNVKDFLFHSVFFNDIKVLDKNAIYATIIVKQFFSKTDITEKYSKYLDDPYIDLSVVKALLKDSFFLIEDSRTRLQINKINFLYKSLFKALLYIYYYISYKTNIKSNKPNIICFVGLQEVNKSSIYSSLKKRFEKNKLYNYVKIVHHRPDLFATFAKLKIKIDSSKSEEKEQIVLTNSRFMKYFQISYYSIYFFFVWFQIIKCKLSNGLLIYDRYIYDISVQKNYYQLNQNIISFLCKFLPRPDKIIFVHLNFKGVVDRKNNHSLLDHNNQYDKFRCHLIKNKTNSFVLHSSSDLKETVNTISKSLFYDC